MPTCVIKCCKNRSEILKKVDGISFHRFPTDPILREKWVFVIRQNRNDSNWLPSKFCVICTLHFKKEDVFLTKNGRWMIKKDSVPVPNLHEISDCAADVKPSIQEDPSDLEKKPIILPVVSQSGLSTASDCKDDFNNRNSDLKSTFDIPIRSYLKNKIRKHQLLRAVTLKKMRMLQQKVRRLKKTNTSLKNIIKNLRNKIVSNTDTHNFLRESTTANNLFNMLCIQNSPKRKLKNPPSIRKFCLTLNSYSPKAYEYVRKAFNNCLPHPKTLAKWYAHVKREPGIIKEVLVDDTSAQSI